MALIKQGIRSGLCGADVQILTEMVDLADDALFQRIFIQFQPRYTHSYPISTRQDTISDIDATTVLPPSDWNLAD